MIGSIVYGVIAGLHPENVSLGGGGGGGGGIGRSRFNCPRLIGSNCPGISGTVPDL